MSTGITRCLEFHMVHDPETATVALTMVALTPDGQRVKYEGEGTYGRADDEPHASLSVRSEPVLAGFGDPWARYVADTPTATSSCKVGELRVTKPLTRTLIAPTSCACGGGEALLKERPSGAWEMQGCVCHAAEGQKLIEEEKRRG